ncbi:hypothetical protein J2Z69_000039 [Paenibacillus shirakamiensis]|uniref:Uncharacterized protein n=1 Tax=Paenibacillus shirakamiensis TaxID=1265935 RepID=A0ABS4JBG7_9BACL|nr:hypothetical protein [Paenibacillus shirakamiensis]
MNILIDSGIHVGTRFKEEIERELQKWEGCASP